MEGTSHQLITTGEVDLCRQCPVDQLMNKDNVSAVGTKVLPLLLGTTMMTLLMAEVLGRLDLVVVEAEGNLKELVVVVVAVVLSVKADIGITQKLSTVDLSDSSLCWMSMELMLKSGVAAS